MDINITKAINELGDFFSRMGGANRPRNMKEEEIFLYVLTTLYVKINPSFEVEYLVDYEFLNAMKDIKLKVDTYLQDIQLDEEELETELFEIYNYYDKKLDREKTSKWNEFKDILEKGF